MRERWGTGDCAPGMIVALSAKDNASMGLTSSWEAPASGDIGSRLGPSLAPMGVVRDILISRLRESSIC